MPKSPKSASKPAKGGSNKHSAAHRRTLFVEAYIANGGNAKQAAIACGLAPKSATQTGHRMLIHADVQAQIAARHAKLAEKFSLRTEDVLRNLSQALYFDPRKLYRPDGSLKPIQELDDDTAAALSGLEVVESTSAETSPGGDIKFVPMFTKKVKWLDKNTAREQAIKHLGLYERDNEQAKARATIIIVPAKDKA